MSLSELLSYFDKSPAVRLLRSPNAPYFVDFVQRVFKQSMRIAIPRDDLLVQLAAYQEELQESLPDKLGARPDTYLTDWSEACWLQRFHDASHEEPLYQLTSSTEAVLGFVERALDRELGFVGTESRLKLVIDTLSDLVVGASEDATGRLERLREERREIDEEIERIEGEGRVSRYRPARIRERFATAVGLLRDLQGDFRAVEESFRDITREVQRREGDGQTSRGGILEYALDSEDQLQQEDQGVSFHEFVRLILSPTKTDRVESLVDSVWAIPELEPHRAGLELVRGMVTLLQREADKVMRTERRLSTALRRVLDDRARDDRRRIVELLREIREHATALADDPPGDELGIDLEVDLAIESPFRRDFWSEPRELARVDLTAVELDAARRDAAFLEWAAMPRLDWRELRSRIRHVAEFRSGATLADVLAKHPPEAGVVEVLGYLQIARDDGHDVSETRTEDVVIENVDSKSLVLTVPLVAFRHRGGNGHV